LDQSSGSSGRTEGAASARCKARIPKTKEAGIFSRGGCFFPEGGQHVKNTRALSSRLAAVVVVTRLSVAGLPIRLLACLHTHGLSIA